MVLLPNRDGYLVEKKMKEVCMSIITPIVMCDMHVLYRIGFHGPFDVKLLQYNYLTKIKIKIERDIFLLK